MWFVAVSNALSQTSLQIKNAQYPLLVPVNSLQDKIQTQNDPTH